MKKIKIRLFGAFRNLETASEIELHVSEEIKTISQLKSQLADHWGDNSGSGQRFDVRALIQKSAMANEREILLEDELIATHESLAILPPVSGG